MTDMEKLDRFAEIALPGMLKRNYANDVAATQAYHVAREMMKARECARINLGYRDDE